MPYRKYLFDNSYDDDDDYSCNYNYDDDDDDDDDDCFDWEDDYWSEDW